MRRRAGWPAPPPIAEECPRPTARGVAFCLAMLEQEARGIGLTLAAHLIAVAREAVDEEATLAVD